LLRCVPSGASQDGAGLARGSGLHVGGTGERAVRRCEKLLDINLP